MVTAPLVTLPGGEWTRVPILNNRENTPSPDPIIFHRDVCGPGAGARADLLILPEDDTCVETDANNLTRLFFNYNRRNFHIDRKRKWMEQRSKDMQIGKDLHSLPFNKRVSDTRRLWLSV